MLDPSITLEQAVHTAHVEVVSTGEVTSKGILTDNFDR